MTLEDFKAKGKVYQRFETIRGLAFFALILAAGISTVFVGKRVDKIGFDTICIVVLAVSYPLIAALMFYVMALLPQRRLRQLGLTCPTCKARLIGHASQGVATTGRCGSCGCQVLEST